MGRSPCRRACNVRAARGALLGRDAAPREGTLPADSAAEVRPAPRWRRLLADITPLQTSPAYRRVWFGQVLSGIGTQMTAVALAIQVYNLTQSAFAVGLIGMAQLG